ncbi:MAG: ABC transporter permease [Bryobacteraceae bacterium]
MTHILQDLRFAFRQLRKTPGLTFTVLLTLALGIGANDAIFTLVNAVLLRNLLVTNPQSLVRLGDDDDCCVNPARGREDGKTPLFSTDAYHQLRKNLPEFEDLSAMQAGFGYKAISVRRDGPDSFGRTAVGEFVSGNYFRTLGLRPRAGRLITDGDDIQGVPATAVMSYKTWQHDYGGNPSVVGGTFYVNTKPVTVVGIAPEKFFGDRLSSKPRDFYLPIEAMPVLFGVSFVHDPEMTWLYIVGRLKPGVPLAPLQQNISSLARQLFAPLKAYSTESSKLHLARVHVFLAPAGGGIQELQEQYASDLHLLTWISALVLLVACANVGDRIRQKIQEDLALSEEDNILVGIILSETRRQANMQFGSV